MQETDEEAQQAADMIRHRAMGALDRADATLAAARPWAESAAEWERAAREREREPDTARPARAAPSRAAPAPSPPPAAADDDDADFEGRPVRMGTMTRVLQTLVREERERAATTIGELERRIAALEARAAGETKKAKRK